MNKKHSFEPYKTVTLGNGRGIAKVSEADYLRVAELSWCLSGTRYAVAWVSGVKRKVYLHRFVMNLVDPTLQVDHINHDPLDCRRTNLRVCTRSENQWNKTGTSRSGFKGVYFYPWNKNKNRRWMSNIMWRGKRITLGYFAYKEQAAEAYNIAAKSFFGKFALLNKRSQYE